MHSHPVTLLYKDGYSNEQWQSQRIFTDVTYSTVSNCIHSRNLTYFSSEPAIHLYSEAEECNPHHNILLHYMHFNITLLRKINILEFLCFLSVG
jgi:hypothetical protein